MPETPPAAADPLFQRVQTSLNRQGLMRHLGARLLRVEPGLCFLSARQGGELRPTGRVVRAGQRIIVTTAEVLHIAEDGRATACAVSQQTLAPVPMQY